MFSSGKITPKADIPMKDKSEITNIMNYMYQIGHTSKVVIIQSVSFQKETDNEIV